MLMFHPICNHSDWWFVLMILHFHTELMFHCAVLLLLLYRLATESIEVFSLTVVSSVEEISCSTRQNSNPRIHFYIHASALSVEKFVTS